MMKFIFNTIVQFLFSKEIQLMLDNYANKKLQEHTKLEYDRRTNFEKSLYHNKLVINVCESDVNPVVGYVVDWCDSMPIIKDLVSDQTLLCGGVMMPYNEDALRAVCSLTPHQRYNLLAKREQWSVNKTRLDTQAVTADEIIRCVAEADDLSHSLDVSP